MNSKDLIAKNIRELRKLKGVSQEQMAKDLGMNPVTIRYYEYGDRFPKPDAMDAIAEYFRVPVSSLFGEPGDRQDDSLDIIRNILTLDSEALAQLNSQITAIKKGIEKRKQTKSKEA